MEMRAMRGAIQLHDDGTYTEEFETQLSGTTLKNDIVTTRNVSGTYALQGATLTLSPTFTSSSMTATSSKSPMSGTCMSMCAMGCSSGTASALCV